MSDGQTAIPAAVATVQAAVAPAPAGALNLAQLFELGQRKAKLYASSTLVPQDFQGNVANCMIALNLAARLGADELMVMQNLYVVHGRPGWSAQFLIATFNQCGRFTSMRFEFFGPDGKDDYGCRAWATEKSTGERIAGSDVTIGLAKTEGWWNKKGSKWPSMTQQMLMYRSGAWLVKAYAPELSMGLQTVEELRDMGPPKEMSWQPAATAALGSGLVPIGPAPGTFIVDSDMTDAELREKLGTVRAERSVGGGANDPQLDETAPLPELGSQYDELDDAERLDVWRQRFGAVTSAKGLAETIESLAATEGLSPVVTQAEVFIADAKKRLSAPTRRNR